METYRTDMRCITSCATQCYGGGGGGFIPINKKERDICEFEMDFKKLFFVAVLIQVMMT